MAPMNLKNIISRGYVLHVRQDSRTFQDERYYPFFPSFAKYSWQYRIETFMHKEKCKYLHTYTNEDETNKCFEIMYESNHNLLEKSLDNVGAKLVTVTQQYIQTLGGFKHRTTKMPYPRGILFDTMHHKMLYLIRYPYLYDQN